MTSSWAGLEPADLDPALDERLALADGELDAAVESAGDAARVLRHLDRAARHAIAGFGRSGTLWAVHPDPDLREAAQAAMVRYEAWRSRTFARRDLFGVLAAIDDSALAAPEARHLSLWRASQRVNGAHLDDAGRAELERLIGRASELAVAVSAAFTDDLPYLEVTPAALDGVTAEVLARFEPGAPGTVRVPVDYQTRDPFLAQVRDRDLRERFWRTFQDRGLATSLEPMRELFETRRAIARLSGFESWAALRTATSSVRSVAAAEAILDGMAGPSRSAAAAFIEACGAVLADQLHGDAFQPWDQFAAIDALTRSIGADREAVRQYLTVDAVTDGLFRLAREVFGIRVEERPGGMGWHEDVRTLALIDEATGEQLGTCLWDPWDRLGKMAGTVGFMDLLEADPPDPGTGAFPPAVTMLVTMFPRPADGSPAHIGVGDAEVLFHEFGHVLDFTIGSRRSIGLDDGWWGTDWVEGPSFSIGFWSRAPEVIATYARHPETGEPVPAALVEGLALAQAIEDVPYVAKYIQLARVDLAVHGPAPVDLDDAWRRAAADTLFPDPLGEFRPYALSLLAGGYDAALYGVVYALEIRDELLAAFARGGWLSPATGRAYIREVLVPGAFVPPVQRLEAFLGHPPTSGPLVDRLQAAIDAVRGAAAPST